ncbi:DNA-directed RNA polymerase subunit beta family protein [Anoxybacillus sp. B7M1]|jgi:anti-sigma factor RsiW|uniref:DNA-directed RNA polymerase subunit beta n=1 Tax=unclassified Anoxybacillus TaxID=2639704 RepID=UPI0005CD0A22|nr:MULTISPECIES: DNA-directed RNA polymerase subunit beta [unclassified Anoxybacillus]ANB57849.1 DNA-directed RNA polymerase subunit beta family protein [Anoxybacillus sp. B2M1]ANB63032.1 DNA-directed RNA polymerase subunit beta family protein [Anoxybacillus sp. B7M1]
MDEQQRQEEKQPKRRWRRSRTRLFPIWLRLLLVLVLVVISTAAGAMIGYSVLGDGKPLDVLKPATWQHIVEIVTKDVNSK